MPAAGVVGASKVARSVTVCGVEDGDVGIGARGENAAAGEPEPGGRQAGHAAHRLFEPEQAELPAVMAEDAREGAPQPRMRVRIVRQPVGADHRVLEAQDALHIGLVHHPIDRARRLQPLDRLAACRRPNRAAIAESSRPACSGALFDQVTSTFSARSACAALSTVEEAI